MKTSIATKFKETEIGPIPEAWGLVNLGSVAKFNQGLQVPVEDQLLTKENNFIRFIRIVDFTKSGDEPPRYIKNVDNSSYKTEEDDLIMIRYGSQTAGRLVRGLKGIIANNMFKISLTDTIVDKNYLYTYLSQKNVYDILNSSQSSSTMPAITFGMISALPIPIPSINEQKQIAEILSSLDDKIELNRKININLEKLASSLFKQWFVDFEFPNEDGKPYKSSEGKMMDSELGEIPIDWVIYSFVDIVKQIKPGTNYQPDRTIGGIPFVTGKNVKNGFLELKDVKYISEIEYKRVHESWKPEEHDILITRIGTLGNVGVIRGIDLPVAVHYNNIDIKQKDISFQFLFYLINSSKFMDQFHLMKKQSVQEYITIDDVENIKIILPKNLIEIKRLEKIFINLFDIFEQTFNFY